MKQTLILVVLVAFIGTGCDKISQVKDHFFGSKKVSETKKTDFAKQSNKEQSPPGDAGSALLGAPSEQSPPINPENLKKYDPPKKEPSLFTPGIHLAGRPTGVFKDDTFAYFSFGRHVEWVDEKLELKGFLDATSSVKSIQSGKFKDGTRLYIQSEGNVLEIFDLPASGPAKSTKFFQVDGPFQVLFRGEKEMQKPRLFVFLEDKVQVINLENLEALELLAELPIHAQAVYSFKDKLYFLTSHSIEVVLSTGEIFASVPVSAPVKLLGVGGNNLLLAVGEEKWSGIYFLPLLDNGGCKGPGNQISFTEEADNIVLSQNHLIIFRGGVLSLFDWNKKIEITGPRLLDGLRDGAGSEDALYLITDQAMASVSYNIFEANYSWVDKIIQTVPSSVNQLLLIGDTLILAGESGIYYTKNHPPFRKLETEHSLRIKAFTRKGVLLQDANQGLFLLAPDLAKLEPVLLPSGTSSFTYHAESNRLFTVMNMTTSEKTGPALVVFDFSLKPKQIAQVFLDQEITDMEAYSKGNRVLMACGNLSCMAHLENGVLKISEVALMGESATVAGISISPNERYAVLLLKDPDTVLSFMNLRTRKEISRINVDISEEKFSALSYSKGGEILLLPSGEGLIVYDLKDPKNPKEMGKWQIGEAMAVDVTNKGNKVCVALGKNGIECGEISGSGIAPTDLANPS